MLAWLRNWWPSGMRASATPKEVVMYTRAGCHLCDDAWQVLENAKKKHEFSLRRIDVDEDAELRARFGLEVPVVTIDGRTRFRGQVNPVLLHRLLNAAS